MNLILHLVGLLSLIALGYNILFLDSFLLGVVVSPIYLFILSLLCGNVFFHQHSLRFRTFYGLVIFYCLLLILGTVAYWVHDLSNLSILAILLILTISLIGLNWKRHPVLSPRFNNLKTGFTKLNMGILDILFLSLMGLSFYFLFAARTGESIPPPWDIVSSWFFVCLILATIVLLVKIWLGKSPSGLLLFYVILLVLIPASGFLILMHQPYFTMKGATPLHWQNMLTQFGTFSPPGIAEAAKSLIGKGTLGVGLYMGNTSLIKLFQFSPLKFGLFFVPLLFTMTAVFASFDLMQSLAPKRKRLALLCSLSFLATQHTIFLFTPPGKDETLALGLLMISMMLWVKFLENRSRVASFIASALLLGAILLIHQWVALFALFMAILAATLFLFKPFKGSLLRLSLWLGFNIGLLVIWTYGYPYLHSFASYVVGSPAGSTLDIQQFTFSKFMGTIAPTWWSGENMGIWQNIFYTFINNSVYFTYIFIIIGVVAAFRYRLNKKWLVIILSLITVVFLYFSVIGNLHVPSESYRFFYYLNFITFPLMGIGLYWLISYIAKPKTWLHTISEDRERFISLKPVQLAICGLLLSSLFISSIYAGYPRENSMGYHQAKKGITYPSDHDVAAINFIKATEGDNTAFFVVADTPTCAAGVATMGQQVISTAEGYVSVFSFFHSLWGTEEVFKVAWKEPLKYLVEGTEYSNSFANTTYLIFTYRLGMDKLKSLVEVYSNYLDEPVYTVEDKVCVFNYDKEKTAAILGEGEEEQLVLFDDEPTDEFWKLSLIGEGNLAFSINDNADIQEQGDSCLHVTISPGEHKRATLSHEWTEPLSFGKANYLLLWVYGTGSGQQFNLAFRSVEPAADNYFIYLAKDDFTGWKLLAIPLQSFEAGGSPSWQVISGVLIQFAAGWSPGEIYFDRISVVERVPLRLLYEGLVISLP